MRKLLLVTIFVFLLSGSSFAQSDMNLTEFGSISSLKKQIEPFTDAFHSGLNVLTFTDASAPSVFGVSVSVFSGFSSIEKNPDIGLKDEGYIISTLGAQAGFGTAGFEIYLRYFPELETSGFKIDAIGFGLKCDLTDMIPVTGFPSTSAYVEYNSQNFSVNKNRSVSVDDGTGNNVNGTVKSGIDMGFSTINIGAIVGYDLVLLGVYGKLGVELGNTNISWNQAVVSNGVVVADGNSGDISSTAMRYAIGLTLFGFRAEFGGRGSNTSAGLGYGISF